MTFPSEIYIGAVKINCRQLNRIIVKPETACLYLYFWTADFAEREGLSLLCEDNNIRTPFERSQTLVMMFPDSVFSGQFSVTAISTQHIRLNLNLLYFYSINGEYSPYLEELADRIARED